MRELNKLTVSWGEVREITGAECRHAQMLKFVEEGGELFTAYLLNDLEGVKDALGNLCVVLCLLCKQSNLNPDIYVTNTCSGAKDVTFDGERFLELTVDFNTAQGLLAENIVKNKDIRRSIHRIVYIINNFAHVYNLTLEECYHYAYTQIADRSGEKVNGVFVKSSDL